MSFYEIDYHNVSSLHGNADVILPNNYHENLSMFVSPHADGYELYDACDIDKVEKCYIEALQNDGDFIESHYNYANFLLSNDRRLEAIEHYEFILFHNPEHSEAVFRLSEILIDLKLYHEAEYLLRFYLKRFPDDECASSALGMSLIHQGKMAEGWYLLSC